MPDTVAIAGGDLHFVARWERTLAPKSCAALGAILPLEGNLLQARWSGESAWMPLGDLEVGVGEENATSDPVPGQILLYPKAVSETEILFPYGATVFASKFGKLAGNHCLTLIEGQTQLAELGRRVVWLGAQPIRFSR